MAQTDHFDKGMAKVAEGATRVSAVVTDRVNGIGSAMTSLGQLSGLGGTINSFVSKFTTAFSQVKAIVLGVTGSFMTVAETIIRPFTAVAGFFVNLGALIGKTLVMATVVVAINSAFSMIGAAISTTVNIVKTGLGLITGFVGAIVGAVFSVIGSVISTVASSIGSALSSLAGMISTTLGNAVTFLGGLVANIPIGGIGIAIGAVVVAATAGAAAFGLWAAGATIYAGAVAMIEAAAASLTVTLSGIGTSAAFGAFLLATPIGLGLIAGSFLAAGAAAIGFAMKLHSMAVDGAKSISDISKLARELGITTQSMAALSLGGADGAFSHGLLKMQRGIEDMSSASIAALAKIGLDANQLRGLDADVQLRRITEGFATLTDHGQQASVALGLFGKSGYDMMDTLAKGTVGLDMMAARAERFGLTFTASQAAAIRSANREWAGFGQALEGISRQAAVLFAPLWEWIGKIGGQVGEWLVTKFRDFASVAQAALPDIQRVAGQLWASMQSGIEYVTTAFTNMGASWGLTWTSISDFGLSVLAGVIVAFDRIGDTWSEVTTACRIAWLTFLNTIKEPFSVAVGFIIGVWKNFPAAWDVAQATMELAWIDFTKSFKERFLDAAKACRAAFLVMLTPGAAFAASLVGPNQAIAEANEKATRDALRARINAVADVGAAIRAEQARVRDGWIGDLAPEIANLNEALRGGVGNFADAMNALVAKWRLAMQDIRADVAAPIRMAPIDVSLNKSVTGSDATLAGSERAFSLLYGSKSNADFYQSQIANGVKKQNELTEKMTEVIRQLPRPRAANF